ncbi:MAG: homoserine O-succinyltransferase [Gammaproteobacteria bacterium]|nr:MAG: homoserine O-succinyltransferase [Gammaproteobacteria bacterium]
MPLVAHNDLPSYQRLRHEGYRILSPERARSQAIRPIHIGLLNMMPDTALEATERQFFRLIGSSNPITQFFVHPFTLDSIPRGARARAHIDGFYESFDDIRRDGLDALIVSGANVIGDDLSREVFWGSLCEVFDWADANVTSTLCSCLATHALMLSRHGVRRRGLAEKCWGVFEHKVTRADHPLVADINTELAVPHSRFNEITREQFEAAGLHVLIEGEESGVQLVVSPDGFRQVCFQGHPEYDSISLLKEYKREVARYFRGETDRYPPFPRHYFDLFTRTLFDEYAARLRAARAASTEPPAFPERLVVDRLGNTWHDSGEALVGNWIGLVYQITHVERELPYMHGVNRDDPLGWLGGDVSRLT